MKGKTIAGLDIGTSSIKAVIADVVGDNDSLNMKVIGVGEASSGGVRKGNIVNIDNTVKSILEAVQKAENMACRKVSSYYVTVSGQNITGLSHTGSIAIKGGEVTQNDIAKVMDDAKAVKLNEDSIVVHVIPQDFSIDEQDGIKNPLGMSGVRLSSKVYIMTANAFAVKNVFTCMSKCGLNTNSLIISSYASAHAVVTPEEKELGCCLIDIGGGTTDISVFCNGSIAHSAVLPFGGDYITNDIAKNLVMPISEAENIKCRYGSLQGSHGERIEIPSIGGREYRLVDKNDLTNIIVSRIEELFNYIVSQFAKFNLRKGLSAGIILTGGTSLIPNLVPAAKNYFNMPVRIGSNMNASGLDLVNSPQYAASVGAIRYGFQKTSDDLIIQDNGTRGIIKRVKGIFSKYF